MRIKLNDNICTYFLSIRSKLILFYIFSRHKSCFFLFLKSDLKPVFLDTEFYSFPWFGLFIGWPSVPNRKSNYFPFVRQFYVLFVTHRKSQQCRKKIRLQTIVYDIACKHVFVTEVEEIMETYIECINKKVTEKRSNDSSVLTQV